MITGYFESISVPEVAVGEDIKATIDFYALNPGALYWKTFLIADSPGLNLRKVLDAAREIGQEGGREKTYTLGKMPNKDVAISFFIFAHDDAGYDWDWSEYNAWMMGFAVEVTHLASEYKFLSPGAEPPPPVDLSGIITRVEPSQFVVGQPIDLQIDFNAYMESVYYQVRGWETSLQAVVDGLSDSDAQTHYGRDGSRTGETLQLGAMPNRTLTGKLTLYGRGMALPQQSWKVLDTKNLVITASTIPEDFFPLEVDITPAGAGYVTTEPPPVDISNHFINGTVGKFAAGTRVLVTAHPSSGYEFFKWSDEIQGGVSYSNPEYVAGVMDEHRAVKAHFVESGVPPPECTIDADCPPGYICQNGVCVPEGEVPPITCSIDADCPEGYKCQDGVCVKKKWWETGWLLPAAIVGVALLLTPGKKAKKGK